MADLGILLMLTHHIFVTTRSSGVTLECSHRPGHDVLGHINSGSHVLRGSRMTTPPIISIPKCFQHYRRIAFGKAINWDLLLLEERKQRAIGKL